MFSCHCVSSLLIIIFELWVILPSTECAGYQNMNRITKQCKEWPEVKGCCNTLISKYKFSPQYGEIKFNDRYRTKDWFRDQCVQDFCREADAKLITRWDSFLSEVCTRVQRFVYSGKDVVVLYNIYKDSKNGLESQHVTLILTALIAIPSKATRNKYCVPLEKRTLSSLLDKTNIASLISAITERKYTSVDVYDFLQCDIHGFYNRYKDYLKTTFKRNVPFTCRLFDVKDVVVTYSDAKKTLPDETMFRISHSVCANKEKFNNRSEIVKKILIFSIATNLPPDYTMALLAKVEEVYFENSAFFKSNNLKWSVPAAMDMTKRTCGNVIGLFGAVINGDCLYNWVKIAFLMERNNIDRNMVEKDFDDKPDQSSAVQNLSLALAYIHAIDIHKRCENLYNHKDTILLFYIGFFTKEGSMIRYFRLRLHAKLNDPSCVHVISNISKSVEMYTALCNYEKPNSTNKAECKPLQTAMRSVLV